MTYKRVFAIILAIMMTIGTYVPASAEISIIVDQQSLIVDDVGESHTSEEMEGNTATEPAFPEPAEANDEPTVENDEETVVPADEEAGELPDGLTAEQDAETVWAEYIATERQHRYLPGYDDMT